MLVTRRIIRPSVRRYALSFELSEEQRAIRSLARQFTAENITPKAAEHDRTGEYPKAILEKAWHAGLLNSHVPKEYGGAGLGVLEGCIIAEELAFGCTGIQTAAEANGLAAAPLLVAATDKLKKRFLGRLTEKPRMAAYCVTEPGAGSDVAAVKTRAVRLGDGRWEISGQKQWITNGSVADWYFVLARTGKEGEPGHGALTGFAVEASSNGITVGRKELNMGQRASDTRAVTFDRVIVGADQVVGEVGQGFKVAMAAFDVTRPLIGAAAVGLARRALHESRQYSLERRSMGRLLIEHQAIAFMLADMATGIEAARLLVHKAALEQDMGVRNTFTASCAKVFASEAANKAAADAVQIFGGAGYNNEYPVEKLLRDAKIFQIYEGTSQIQRLIIGRLVADEKYYSSRIMSEE